MENKNDEDVKRMFKVGAFEGPLDLLLFYIHKNQINIYDIPISEICEQFLRYIDYAKELELSNLTEFYKMASMLLCIKSRMLLPVAIELDDEEFEDPRDTLVEKLIEYQKYRKLSELLEEKENKDTWLFERSKISRTLPKKEESKDWEVVDPEDALVKMRGMFKRLLSSISHEKILNMNEEISVNEKVTLIDELLASAPYCMFSELHTRPGSLLDIVCAFMAILEVVKDGKIEILQHRIFEDIKIQKKAGYTGRIKPLEITIDKIENLA